MAKKNFLAGNAGNTTDSALQKAANIASDSIANSEAEKNKVTESVLRGFTGGGDGLKASATQDPRSAYIFKPENIVASGTDGNIPLNLQFDPNLLDKYDVVTYHWKFFMVNPATSTTGKVFNTRNQTIIAETGVSDLTIDKVELTSICTPTVEGGTGTTTHFKFEILEPAGAALIDKIFYQSVAMGIGNWNVMPFYLQLQFKGRTPDASAAEDGSPGEIGNLKWLWALKLTSIKANVTTVGTRYEFTAIIYNELAQSNAYFTMQSTTVLRNLDKFGDAMVKLQEKLNEDQIYSLLANTGVPDSYRIVVDSKLAKYTITPDTANKNSIRANNTVAFAGKDATFPASTSIDKVIDSILSQTSEAQNGLIGSKDAGQLGVPMNEEISQMKLFWRITTQSRPIKYDVRRQLYANEFVIYVYAYDLGIMESNSFQDSAPPLTQAAERKRLATYAKHNILKKKYNYIYTGLNDQIINFDIKINNAFASATARMSGIYNNAAMHDMGVVAQQHAVQEAKISSQLRQAISLMNTSSTDTDLSVGVGGLDGSAYQYGSVREVTDSINNSTLSDDRKAEYLKILKHMKPESRLNFVRSIQDDGGILPSGFVAKDLATPRSEKVSAANLRFISDVDQTGEAAKQAYRDYAAMLRGKLRPQARIDSMHQTQVGQGMESNSNSGLQKLSSMFAVALHSSLDGSYAQVNMTIKGDPFWLFPQPYSDAKEDQSIYITSLDDATAIDRIKFAHRTVTSAANLIGTDNFIIIRFRTPKVFSLENNENGENAITDVEMFSGVFKVISLKSKFENGKFIQDIYCQLDPQLNILDFWEEIELNAGKKDATPRNADLRSTDLPSQFTKESRLSTGEVSPVIIYPGKDALAGPTARARAAVDTYGNSPVQVFIGPTATSNLPVPRASIIPGLPDRNT
jgi:hypothetical protein